MDLYICLKSCRNKNNDITNSDDNRNKVINTSRHYAVVTLRCEDHTEHEYETIPNKQEMEPKASSDHFYDDTVNTKCNNDKFKVDSTLKEGTNTHNINQNKPMQLTASETHSDMSIGKDLSPPHVPPKPTTKSFHKSFSSQSANKPTAFPATKTAGDQLTDKDPPNIPPKPIVRSIHKPISSSNKPTASSATKNDADSSTDKDLPSPPKPIVKSTHKRLLLRKRYVLKSY